MGADSEGKIREQFDAYPYPDVPLETSPREYCGDLYLHDLVTSYYLRNQQITGAEGKLILDAGCGTGFQSLVLAHANPGARIVGIDLSPKSVEMARERMRRHGFENCEFHVLPLEELPALGLSFDYINCDDVLYLLPDPLAGLMALKSVLSPEGILRANLHSSLQRSTIFRAQEVFGILGVLDGNPGKEEISQARDFMNALMDPAHMKQSWGPESAEADRWVLSNHLLQGDRGYTIPDLFSFLKAADLEFISMVDWQTWNVEDLFKEVPPLLSRHLPQLNTEQQLHLFELIHANHRLLDVWCGHAAARPAHRSLSDRTEGEWMSANVILHPQLRTGERKKELQRCAESQESFLINQHIRAFAPVWIESALASCLLPLWDGAQPFRVLADRWLQIRPVDPVTLKPVEGARAVQDVQRLLVQLELPVFVLLEFDSAEATS